MDTQIRQEQSRDLVVTAIQSFVSAFVSLGNSTSPRIIRPRCLLSQRWTPFAFLALVHLPTLPFARHDPVNTSS